MQNQIIENKIEQLERINADQQEKIEQLEKLYAYVNEQYKNLAEENKELKDKSKTITKTQAKKLKEKNEQGYHEYVQELKNKQKQSHQHNERGAGRKSKLDDQMIKDIKGLHGSGKSMAAIAEIYKISPGTVHKAIHS